MSIHPFIDGNGRISRLLMNLALIQCGYIPVAIPPICRPEYLTTIRRYQSNGDYIPFTEFVADRMVESQKELMRLFHIDIPKLDQEFELKIDFLGNLEKEKNMINFLNNSKKLTYSAEVDGSIMNMDYLLFAPNGHENMRPLPIVLFLHSSDETWSEGTSETVILQKMIDDGNFPCIILAPKCSSNWCDWQPATLASRIVNEIKNAYNCDSERYYIMGFGMGAFAVYDFIGHKSDNGGIAGAVSIGGAYMFELIENIKRVPLWIFYGDSDYEVENYSKKMVAELEKVGGNYKSTDYTSADSIIDFICDKTDLFTWLFAQKRSKEN